MPRSLRVDQTNETLSAGPSLQTILCSYCVLRWWEHDDLSAPFWRWYWNDRPGAFLGFAGERIELTPDRVLLIPPETPCSSTVARPVMHLFLHFTTGLRVRPEYRRPVSVALSATGRRDARDLGERLRRADAGRRQATHYFAHAQIAAAMTAFPDDGWDSAAFDPDVARVLSVMFENPARPLGNDTLSDIAAVSHNTLLRRFRAATGTTPHQYLARLRVDRAAVELRATRDSIDAIAVRNGFCDRFHFSRAFKRLLGTTPAAHRAAHALAPSPGMAGRGLG